MKHVQQCPKVLAASADGVLCTSQAVSTNRGVQQSDL